MASTYPEYYHADQSYYGVAEESYGLVCEEMPLSHDLLDCFPATIDELDAEIRLPPRPEQRQQFSYALAQFESAQSEWNCQIADAWHNYTPPSPQPSSSTPSSPTLDEFNTQHHCPEPHCGQVFKRANALQRHVSSIHQKQGVFCPFCPAAKKRFNRSDNFQRHVVSRHKTVAADDEALQRCIRTLYQGNGRRTSWRKKT
ncbi:hypothetical protein EDC01DRAFT_777864 [Geopyxis carbonaria]|nr:hypothetical protein EDC01DRAFT_777864 [Geopyxis carbonaria]